MALIDIATSSQFCKPIHVIAQEQEKCMHLEEKRVIIVKLQREQIEFRHVK